MIGICAQRSASDHCRACKPHESDTPPSPFRDKRRGCGEAADPTVTAEIYTESASPMSAPTLRLRAPNTVGSGDAVKTLNTTQGVRKKKSIALSR